MLFGGLETYINYYRFVDVAEITMLKSNLSVEDLENWYEEVIQHKYSIRFRSIAWTEEGYEN